MIPPEPRHRRLVFRFGTVRRGNRVWAALIGLLFAALLAMVLFGLGLFLAAAAGVALAGTLARAVLGRPAAGPVVRDEAAEESGPRVITGEYRAIPDGSREAAERPP